MTESYIFDISIEGLSDPKSFRALAAKSIDEINDVVGKDHQVRLTIEPISKVKKTFSLSIMGDVNGHPIQVTKKGKKTSSLLKRAKKAFLNSARRAQMKEIKRFRKASIRRFKPSLAS